MNETTIIEINGIKLEVDLRHAKRIDQFKVGDKIKVLIKGYNENYTSHIGVIAGFDNFQERPSIIIAYLESSYSPTLKFVHLNKGSKDIEICSAHDFDFTLEKGEVVAKMDSEINKKKDEINDLEVKKKYFIEQFSKHFEPQTPNQ